MPRKSTPAQQAASRANGQRSAGPPRGPRTATINPLARRLVRQRATANTICLTGENRAAFHKLLRSFIRDFAPATDTEFLRVETLATIEWRLRRLWEAERATLDHELLTDSQSNPTAADLHPSVRLARAERTLTDSTRTVDKLHLQEARLIRSFNTTLSQLQALQKNHAPLTRHPLNPKDQPRKKPFKIPGNNPAQPEFNPAIPGDNPTLDTN